CLALLPLYRLSYSWLFARFGDHHAMFTVIKLALALTLLFPSAFCMGGTFPIVNQYLVRNREKLGRTASMLYFLNTLGAAIGAYTAGFHLPVWFGLTGAYSVAIALAVLLGGVAIWLGGEEQPPDLENPSMPDSSATSPLSMRTLCLLSAASGFVTLGLEVMWTRMFAQVLQNSGYTFSTVLVTFLFALALGGSLAHGLIRRGLPPVRTLSVIMIASALLIAATPFVFHAVTDGLGYLGSKEGWLVYVANVFGTALLVMFPATLLMGAVYPMVIRLSEGFADTIGLTVGRLAAANTLGAIAGSLTAGFLLMEWLGLWSGIRFFALAYLLMAFALQRSWIPLLGFMLIFSLADPSRLPIVRIDHKKKDRLLETRESSDGIVAVVDRAGKMKIKVNNNYALGGTGARNLEEIQSDIPLTLHPNPKHVFYLGMGTGITAGAALRHPVERIVVSELVADAVRMAELHFEPYLNGLFTDDRARIVIEDGRNVLAGTRETFDLIIADLFLPWKAGTGALYTREHYRTSLRRLRPGGLYVQWIPLYQMTSNELGTIARTMSEVFGTVTLWRGDFFARKPIIALIGHTDSATIPAPVLARLLPSPSSKARPPTPLLLYYGGQLDQTDEWIRGARINTDNRPIIEYLAPRNHRAEKAGQLNWVTGPRYRSLLQ
ncbi:MAG: fused MFS/spermidine synthase, partial [Verrucomicrobiota bacterium]